jgi:thiol-disulfide isomerase/thioredoxin
MNKSKNLIIGFVVIGILIYAAYAFYNKNKPSGLPQQPQTSQSDTNLKPSAERRAAPDIVLKDINERTIRLSDYQGKVVLLNFWASWCPPCKSEMPELDKTAQELANRSDAVLLTVNLTDGVRETADKAKKYINDNHFSMNVLLDTEGKAANDYGISSIPATFIIDKEGRVYHSIVGPTTKDALMGYINKLK